MRHLYLPAMIFVLLLTARMGCVYHMPMMLENDTAQTVLMDISVGAYPRALRLERIEPLHSMKSRHCWKKNDAIFLATPQYPDPIAFDPKDFCDRLCQCDFPVSTLLKQMTPALILKRQQDVCTGEGPLLEAYTRKQLCEAYVRRATGNALSSGTDPAMLRR